MVWGVITIIHSWQDCRPVINQSSGSATVGYKLEIMMGGMAEGVPPILYTMNKALQDLAEK